MVERIAKASKVPVISMHSETEKVSFGHYAVVVTVGILSSKTFPLPLEIAADITPPLCKYV